MSNQQRARLPPTPCNPITTQRHTQNIDVQNNTISNVVTTMDSSQVYNNNNISDDSLNALGPDLAIQTSQVLENLTDQERSIIHDVLSRDESIRQRDSARIMLLRAELHNLKKRSALKTGSLDRPVIIDSNRSCGRCRSDLGRILNRGAPCRACKLRVCKGCREFTNRTDWVCVVCHKQIELQNASGEWMNRENIHTPSRRSSITQPGFIPTAEIIKKSISRSWTISNPEEDQTVNDNNDIRVIHPNLHLHEPSSYPNLIRLNKSPYNSNMDFNNSDSYERTPPTQRRILRQSTLPNPDPNSFQSTNLKIPSPKQQMSPQYSPYHTDNENEPEKETTSVPIPGQRYQIRRQSTLPCKPNELQTSKFLSTSPNRSYSRSPDPSADSEHTSRYPPFVRQSTFPCNNGTTEYHQRQLPTSPNRLNVNKSPENCGENGAVSPRRFMRQTTLPNPDQHIKLLPTSPPKKSPQYIKRSPEFQRQNTISNPEGMSTLSVHGPKFLPISPRQKQNFLFPQPAPRTFLSQQHFPTMNEDQPVAVHPQHPHSKMIKVRSHSNEEYSFSRSLLPPSQQEGRRLLPEIPNRARSPNRLVRQDHVKDEAEKRSPILKTFAEAKQTLNEEYEGTQIFETQYTSEYNQLSSTFAEADETNYTEDAYESYQRIQQEPEIDPTILQFAAETTNQFLLDSQTRKIPHPIRTNENFMNESSSEYFTPDDYIKQVQKNRNRRRKSRELPDPEVIISSIDEDSKRPKPETMRSVSEDACPKPMKTLPRRSFSQPEKETQKKQDSPQLPSPKLLSENKNFSPTRKEKDACLDQVDDAQKSVPKKPVYKFQKMLEMRGDSKSFDAVVRQLIKTDNRENDDKSQSMDDNLFSDKKEHKTTLNEAEIQNAVEQAAGLFKKVVLQRRKERKPAEEGEMPSTTVAGRRSEESSETEMRFPIADGDDYRLVFISSDSSEKEYDNDDSSSTTSSITTKCSIIFDECDWDYFEPSITAANNSTITTAATNLRDFTAGNSSPFSSPYLSRRRLNSSPMSSPLSSRRGISESPLSVRKYRESDTGTTDEEILLSSSPTSSEGFLPIEYLKALKNNHKCPITKKNFCKCGKSPHYVAIPVPILVPMDTFRSWHDGNNPDLLKLFNNTSTYKYEHQQNNSKQQSNDVTNTSTENVVKKKSVKVAAAAAQYQQVMGEKLPEQDDEEKERKRQKISNVSITSNISSNSSTQQSRRSFRNSHFLDNVSDDDKNNFSRGQQQQLNHNHNKSALSKIRKSESRDIIFEKVNNNSDNTFGSCNNTLTHLNETIKITTKHEAHTCDKSATSGSCISAKPYTSNNLIKLASSCSSNVIQRTSLSDTMISVGKLKKTLENGTGNNEGYLLSENLFSSSSESESCDEDDENIKDHTTAGPSKIKSVQRSYDVAGAAESEKMLDNVPNVSSDVDSSNREDDNTSGSVETDSEDTGIEEKRSKSKRFKNVFIVNKNSTMSETDSCSSVNAALSTSEEEETSDNDTDTDGIKLNYIKPLEKDIIDQESTSEKEVVLNYLKFIDDDDNNSDDKSIVLNSIKPILDDNKLIVVNNQHIESTKNENKNSSVNEQKVNGSKSENKIRTDDKNKSNLPSNRDECANQITTAEIDEIVSNCDSLEPSHIENTFQTLADGEFRMDSMEVIMNNLNINSDKCNNMNDLDDEKKSNQNMICNLSMILNGSYDKRNSQTDDVKTSSTQNDGDDEKLLKIESPLNKIHEQCNFNENLREKQQNHDTTSSTVPDSQTVENIVEITGNDIVPGVKETSLHTYQHNLNVSTTLTSTNDHLQAQQQENEHLLSEVRETGNSNNTVRQNNSCVKQNETEEIAIVQELLNTENTLVSSQRFNAADGNGKFTSLVMITQENNVNNNNYSTMESPLASSETQVSVTTSDTTKIITGNSSSCDSIVVQHRNWQPRDLLSSGASVKTKIGFYEENINKVKENSSKKIRNAPTNEKLTTSKIENVNNNNDDEKKKIESNEINCNKSNDDHDVLDNGNDEVAPKCETNNFINSSDDVKVITGQKTLSAVIYQEDGLADDDSWVEEMSQNDDEEFPSTETGSDFDSSDEMSLVSGMDREEELRGYNRVSIDFTLHTIVEESCEESEYESSDRKSQRISASELEKYFFFGLGDGGNQTSSLSTNNAIIDHDESPSETSSVCSEGLDSLNTANENATDCGTLASSRLEKYFLTGFMGFQNDGNGDTDGSGSVGSDSEGQPSPEQRRKKLVRARGTGRSHSSSLDNLLAKEESIENQNENHQQESDNSSETTDTCDDYFDKTENHSDTVKRKKKTKKSESDEIKKTPEVEVVDPSDESQEDEENGRKTPTQSEFLMPVNNNLVQSRKQHSRDSGFIGSNDDLLKSDGQKSPETKTELEEIIEENKETDQPTDSEKLTPVSSTSLIRKDSFNAWSSDEETNLMMSKMRQFFKSLVAVNANNKRNTATNDMSNETPKARQRQRPPQLVYFENELTRLMKTVPGIKDEQVKELVEYFSSEDTWSDSYDSSDYTSSDKESAGKKSDKIQQQISASCQEIIEKFDGTSRIPHLDEEGDMGDGGVLEEGINKETAFVYQKLVASITKIADEKPPNKITNSPPIIAKVMHHIGSRLVALMHEVSSGDSIKSNSPKQSRHHRRLQGKISTTTTEDDDSTSESNFEDPALNNLPRSKSHDLLLDGKPIQDHMTMDERDASDYDRFSWRGSFESALLTNCDSRNKLSNLDNSSSTLSILAAKRRSAGDLLFTPKNLSREQLDRVRSCGSIGGTEHDIENSKLWESTQSQESSRKRTGIVQDDTDESSDNDHHRLTTRSTLPRSLQMSTITASTTNSLPRLPTTSSNIQSSSSTSGAIQKAQSVYQFLQNNVKSARYRAPGFNRPQQVPKRAVSAPGLQPFITRRERRNKVQSLAMDEQNTSDYTSSPVIGNKNNGNSVTPSHTTASSPATDNNWPSQSDEDIDRLVAMHQNRHNSLSSLGLRSDSMASVYSGAGEGRYGTVQVKGMVEFGMQYNYKQCALEILVKQCKDLAAVDTKRNRSDPYVKVYLLPDKTKSGKRKTKVKKHTLNPVFDEVLRFYMSLSSLESRTLWLTVWHSDMFGRNDFLGEVMISLQNKIFDNPMPQWYQLEERSEPFEDVTTYRGDIIVGLKFIPGSDPSGSSHTHGLNLRKFSLKSNSSASSANNNGANASTSCSKNTKGSLHILVKEAKHLSPVKANGNCDAFCKSYLLPDKNRGSKQKTQVIKRSINPQWNYTFVYDDVTLADLSERALELTIWDHDRLASNEFLGGVRFSLGTGKHYGRPAEWNDANGKELTLWQSMINRPNFWVEGCLALRSSLENRSSS